jgi:hypothetical protein
MYICTFTNTDIISYKTLEIPTTPLLGSYLVLSCRYYKRVPQLWYSHFKPTDGVKVYLNAYPRYLLFCHIILSKVQSRKINE